MKRIIILLAFILLLSGCSSPFSENGDSSASRDLFAMDTYMTVTCYGKQCEAALDAAISEINRLDKLLSIGRADSEISKLNTAGKAILSEDSALMVEKSLEIHNSTQGYFDITVLPLMELWGFTTQNYSVPDEDKLKSVLTVIGSNLFSYKRETQELVLADGQGIDLGGIAKGYCSDRLIQIFEKYDLDCGLISLGGNVQCYKAKPDGSLWRCGIRNPQDPENLNDLAGVVEVEDKAVITSGAYERYFTDDDGTVYHHILDPHTGYPAYSGLSSVTIVSSSGILADALSTACFVMGQDGAVNYWREYGKDFDMILITEEGEVYITEPLKDSFTSDRTIHLIRQ